MSIPSTYLDDEGKPPPKLDVDAVAMFAQAQLVWRRLPSDKMREELADCWTALGGMRSTPGKHMLSGLRARGIVRRGRSYAEMGSRLTPYGLMVWEAGTRTPTSAGES